MKTSFLPITVRHLAATTAIALLSASAFAQVPAPGAPAAPGAAPAATPAPKPFSATEKNFIKNAGKSMYFMIQVATAAKTVFSDPTAPTTRLRETTIKDLGKAWEALNKLAQTRGETLPAELTGSDKSAVERLGKLKEDKFAKEWIEELSKEAKKLDRDFESAGKSSYDPDLKTYASNYTPMVHSIFTTSETVEKGLSKKK